MRPRLARALAVWIVVCTSAAVGGSCALMTGGLGEGGAGAGPSTPSQDAGSSTSAGGTTTSATSTSGTGIGGAGTGGMGTGGAGAGPVQPQMCPTGQLMTGIGGDGQITCTSIDEPSRLAINAGCSIYLGWKDNCDGCSDPPTKWGAVGGTRCINTTGSDDTCTTTTLGSDTVTLFGLNMDGDVDGNDKFYGSLHCGAGDTATTQGTCAPGSARTDATGTCTPLSAAVLGYVGTSCYLYMGWRDACTGCTDDPAKWGSVNDANCTAKGTNGTCSTAQLGGDGVRLLGVNTDGNVGDDDQFYIGLRCDPPPAQVGSTATTCPPGQFAVGTVDDSTVQCESPLPRIADYFANHCSVYFGWQAPCNGCTPLPAEWGVVSAASCANGAGSHDVCTMPMLDGQAVRLFGLNPTDDVDDDDTFYVGFACH